MNSSSAHEKILDELQQEIIPWHDFFELYTQLFVHEGINLHFTGIFVETLCRVVNHQIYMPLAVNNFFEPILPMPISDIVSDYLGRDQSCKKLTPPTDAKEITTVSGEFYPNKNDHNKTDVCITTSRAGAEKICDYFNSIFRNSATLAKDQVQGEKGSLTVVTIDNRSLINPRFFKQMELAIHDFDQPTLDNYRLQSKTITRTTADYANELKTLATQMISSDALSKVPEAKQLIDAINQLSDHIAREGLFNEKQVITYCKQVASKRIIFKGTVLVDEALLTAFKPINTTLKKNVTELEKITRRSFTTPSPTLFPPPPAFARSHVPGRVVLIGGISPMQPLARGALGIPAYAAPLGMPIIPPPQRRFNNPRY